MDQEQVSNKDDVYEALKTIWGVLPDALKVPLVTLIAGSLVYAVWNGYRQGIKKGFFGFIAERALPAIRLYAICFCVAWVPFSIGAAVLARA